MLTLMLQLKHRLIDLGSRVQVLRTEVVREVITTDE
jgi:hypothetical protein